MKENRDFKGVWIPKEVWLNENLSIVEKCLLVEIDSLDNSERGCFASNEYLANFFKLSESRMANIISDLKKRGFINQIFFDGRQRGLRIVKSEVWFTENDKADCPKTVKLPYRKREHNNTLNKTTNNTTNISFENEFSTFEKITIEDSQSSKVNPFTIVAKLQSEKEEKKNSAKRKEESADAAPKPERKPNPTYEAFTVFCKTFEDLSGAAYPTDQKGHYIMNGKDAGGMKNLLQWLEKVDRNNDTNEALKVFLQAAWSLPDKWLKANFTPAILYGQANKVYTAYQTSSPAAKKKAYDDEVDRLLAEYIQTLKQTQ